MKIAISKVLWVFLAILLGSASVYAHHSFAEFDDTATVTIQGVVTEFRLVNPHAMLFFEATDANGKTVKWEVQFDGRTNVGRAGWTDGTQLTRPYNDSFESANAERERRRQNRGKEQER